MLSAHRPCVRKAEGKDRHREGGDTERLKLASAAWGWGQLLSTGFENFGKCPQKGKWEQGPILCNLPCLEKQKETNNNKLVHCFSEVRCFFLPLAHPAIPCGLAERHCLSSCSVVSIWGLQRVFLANQEKCMYIIIPSTSFPKHEHFHLADEEMESLKGPYFLFILMKKTSHSALTVQKSYECSARHFCFPKPLDSRLLTCCPITSDCFSVCFLQTRTVFHLNKIIKLTSMLCAPSVPFEFCHLPQRRLLGQMHLV